MPHGSIHVRFSPDQLRALNAWRRDQPDLPTKPQAIRDLVEEALAARRAQTEVGDEATA